MRSPLRELDSHFSYLGFRFDAPEGGDAAWLCHGGRAGCLRLAAQQSCSHPDQGQSDQHDGQATRRFAPPLLAIGVGYATTNGT